MGDRCTGHCCDTIALSYPPEFLAGLTLNNDALFVLANWRYLGQRTPREAGVLDKAYMLTELREGIERLHFYQCMRWDAETGNCMVYDSRPRLCRDHPTPREGPCERKGCTADSARNRPCGPLANRPEPRRLSIYRHEVILKEEA